MSEEEETLVLIQDYIKSDLTPEEQAEVANLAEKLRSMVSNSPNAGLAAIALVGAEFAAKE